MSEHMFCEMSEFCILWILRRIHMMNELFRLWQFVPDGEIRYLAKAGLVKPLLRHHLNEQLAETLSPFVARFLTGDDVFQPLLQLFFMRISAANQANAIRVMMQCVGFTNTELKRPLKDSADDIQLRWFIFGSDIAVRYAQFSMTKNAKVWWQYLKRLRHLDYERPLPPCLQYAFAQEKEKLIYLMTKYKPIAHELLRLTKDDLKADRDVCLTAIAADPSRSLDMLERWQPNVEQVCEMIESNPYENWEFFLPQPYLFNRHIVMLLHYYAESRFQSSWGRSSWSQDTPRHIFDGFYDNAYIMSYALTLRHSMNPQNLSMRLRGDANFMLYLLALGLDVLSLTTLELRQDVDFIIAACSRVTFSQIDSRFLLKDIIIDSFADHEDVVRAALLTQQSEVLYRHVPERLKHKSSITMLALDIDPMNLAWAPVSFQHDRQVVWSMICQDGAALAFAAQHFQRDPKFIFAASRTFPDVLLDLPRRPIGVQKSDFILNALERCDGIIYSDVWQICLEHVNSDNYERFRQVLLTKDCDIPLKELPTPFHDDIDFIVMYVKDSLDLWYLAKNEKYRKHREIARLLISDGDWSIWGTSEIVEMYTNDVDMMALQVSRCARFILMAPENLMKDILKLAFKEYHVYLSGIYAELPDVLRDDKWLAYKVLEQDGTCLRNMSKRLKDDLAIICEAMTRDPRGAYRYVPKKCRRHPYIQNLLKIATPYY